MRKETGFRIQESGVRWGGSFVSCLLIPVFCFLLSGCATHGGGGGGGPDPDEARLRAEIVRQWTWLRDVGCAGVDPALAANVRITVLHCAASGENSDGPYICAPTSCGRITSGCVHAWESSFIHDDTVTFMLAGTQKDWCIRHEPGHFTQFRWCDDPAELSLNNGHPLAVHIGGKLIKTKDLIAGARWPSIVRGLKFWGAAEGSGFGCAVLDGAGNVLHVKPVPEMQEGGSGI